MYVVVQSCLRTKIMHAGTYDVDLELARPSMLHFGNIGRCCMEEARRTLLQFNIYTANL